MTPGPPAGLTGRLLWELDQRQVSRLRRRREEAPSGPSVLWAFGDNDRSGRRGAVVMLPTEPDDALGSLLDLTIGTAVCQMFGRVPPTVASARAPTPVRLDKTLIGR